MKSAYLQTLLKASLILLLEEVHVLRTVLQDVAHTVFQVGLHSSAGRQCSLQAMFSSLLGIVYKHYLQHPAWVQVYCLSAVPISSVACCRQHYCM